ncbi:PA3611 family quorum-sensing-regulated virulence factor [Azomonas macrocytogenes]|uniref:Quorum-sensing-regulated virulence factor n=1 Tax=Azomonas macrocytogenes TaxID=69962 RepID=A0A839T637_AZOMA|nr:PA3611 family quorum-sensing-regulated virulence factor [Azomonas macrocytogenes]MBB3104961.1 hypothetical protein [Azomonas macrocytogenes]
MKQLPLLLLLCLIWTGAQAQSLMEYEVERMLEQVARESNVGTPRAINSDLLDQGYTVDGTTLVNFISVQPRHAAMMRDNPKDVRKQLTKSVCQNNGFRKLLENGAKLRYEFSEYKSNRPIATEHFAAKDCKL